MQPRRTEPRRLHAIPAGDFRARQLTMLWRERIPAGTLAVIAGRPGLGKSSLATLIAAELSQIGLSSLLSMLEDDPHTIIRPRLDAARADLDLVHIIPAGSALALPSDLDQLEDLIRTLNVSLAVLDPIAAHFNPEHRVHNRAYLYRILALARRTRCTVLCLHHLTQAGTIGGPSGGLSGSSRATYVYGYDPEDEDRRALACEKINGADKPPSLILEHETIDYRNPDGHLLEAGLLRVVGENNASSRRVTHRGRRIEKRDHDCAEWLSLYLAAGEDCTRPLDDLRTVGRAAGYGWQTMLRAAVTMNVERITLNHGDGPYNVWRLPTEHPLRNPDPETTVE